MADPEMEFDIRERLFDPPNVGWQGEIPFQGEWVPGGMPAVRFGNGVADLTADLMDDGMPDDQALVIADMSFEE